VKRQKARPASRPSGSFDFFHGISGYYMKTTAVTLMMPVEPYLLFSKS
jgi:hypothetical protein